MKYLWATIAVLVLLAAASYAAYVGGLFQRLGLTNQLQNTTAAQVAQTAASTDQTSAAVKPPANGHMQADAHVIPVQYADLSFTQGGVLEKLLVKEGDQVAAGHLLAQLNSAQQQVAV